LAAEKISRDRPDAISIIILNASAFKIRDEGWIFPSVVHCGAFRV